MKHCPTCQTQFGGDEAFCPHDGTRLAESTAPNPGHLTGSTLQGVVNLEGFLFSDHIGERYRARLLSDNQLVRVTVFHRRFNGQRLDDASDTRRNLDEPLPNHLLSVHSIHADSEPTFVVEQWPEADPLARVLKKKEKLSWQQALSLTIKVARVLNWMADADVPHRALHPRSIFIDDPKTGSVQFGEWFHGLLTFPLPDLDDDTPDGAIPVYPGFIAPEWLGDDDVDLKCAAVFTAGAVLYAALGQPLYDKEARDGSLRNWYDEQFDSAPLLELPDEAPEAITALAKTMTAPSPDKRFDAPSAAIAALSSILEMSAEDIAPAVEARDERVFSDDRGDDVGDDVDTDDANPRETQLGLPTTQEVDDEDDETSTSDDTPRVIVDETSTAPQDDAIPQQGPATGTQEVVTDENDEDENDADENDESKRSKNTMVMGAVSPVADDHPQSTDRDEKTASEDESQADPDDSETDERALDDSDDDSDDESDADRADDASTDESGAGDTVVNYSLDDADVDGSGGDDESDGDDESAADDDSDDVEPNADDESDGVDESAADDESDPDDESNAGDTVVNYSLDDVDTGSSSTDDEPSETDSSPSSPSGEREPTQKDEASVVVDSELTVDDDEDSPSDDDTAEDGADSAVQTPGDAVAPSEPSRDTPANDSDELSIGFVQAEQSESQAGASDAFFTRSTQDAWEQEAVRASYERSARLEKATRWGMIIGGILIIVGAAVFFHGVYEPDDDDEPDPLAGAEAQHDDEYWDRQIDQFEQALEDGNVVRPRRQSARTFLNELQDHPDEEVYNEHREHFVEVADELSRRHEEAGNLGVAHRLADWANHFSDDEELEERLAKVYEKYQESSADDGEEVEDMASPPDDASQADEPRAGDETDSEDEPTETNGELQQLLDEAEAAKSDGDYETAREKFGAVLDESPEQLEAIRGTAKAYFHDRRHEDALDYQTRAVELAPDNVEARLQLGTVHFRLEEYEEAIEQWDEVLDLDPDNSTAASRIQRAEQRL